MLPKGLLKEYSRAISLVVRIIDMLTVLLAGWLAYVIRFNEVVLPPPYLSALAIALVMTPAVFFLFQYLCFRAR